MIEDVIKSCKISLQSRKDLKRITHPTQEGVLHLLDIDIETFERLLQDLKALKSTECIKSDVMHWVAIKDKLPEDHMFKVEEKRVINYVQSADGNSETIVIDHNSKKVHDFKKSISLLGRENVREMMKSGSICLNGFVYTIIDPV